jgi:predicted dehydrogenase
MAAGRVVAVAENYPHLNAVRAAKAAIAGGAIGAVRAIRTTRAFTLDPIWLGEGWRVADGILLDQGTHHTSLLRQLGGPITAVSAHADRGPGADNGETVSLTVHFASGVIGQSLYSWGTPALEPDVEATVFGATGRIDVSVAYESALGQARLYSGRNSVDLSTGQNYYDSHRSIVEDWVQAIAHGGQPVVSAADANADLAVVLAAIQSVRDGGRTVDVTEVS